MSSEPLPAEAERRIAAARVEAEFAQTEVDGGFPVLHATATVSLWGVLEATVEDVALAFLEHDSACLANPVLSAIRSHLRSSNNWIDAIGSASCSRSSRAHPRLI